MNLCVAIPIVQTAIQTWAIQSGATMTACASVFAGLAAFWSVLRATTYVCFVR